MILFIDDEKRRMDSYVLELKISQYSVIFEQNVDCAIKLFEDHKENINLIILDMMMPTGTVFKNDQTEKGMRTGLCFYKFVRKHKPDLPIIIFTNVSGSDLPDSINENDNFQIFQKDVLFPFELAEQVKRILDK
jgi:CheY-like chemotaxis protein